ncbi:hypothetical protein [Rhizobium leguminosarum]|uniref:hypothetical protein n=1 Tax=Rhizobium leguminosarum TaxID=384 RepID=UPI001441AA39|nr:hypothetical protein [Rhizobium leguminosarum]NKN00862.1 hypothetical protein [Rhizobium leguminosarum bv. viciae]
MRNFKGEADYRAEIEDAFGKFSQAAPKDYRHELRDWSWMNHVEAKILEFVAVLNSALFGRLREFCAAEDGQFVDPIISTFDREIEFYLSYLAYIRPLREDGLPFSYPVMSATSKEMKALDCFDLALAAKLTGEGQRVVANDLILAGNERVLVVSGPNQGGKTTFARTFGQLAYLTWPVPMQQRLAGCRMKYRNASLRSATCGNAASLNAAIKWPAGDIVLVCTPGNETLVAFVLPNQITNVSSRARRGAEKRLVSYRFAVLPYISKYESPADDCVAFGALAVDVVNPCFAADVVLGFGPGELERAEEKWSEPRKGR